MARLDRVRGYTIPDRALYEYLIGIFPFYGPNVIPESIYLVRQGERERQYVIFNTSEPIQVSLLATPGTLWSGAPKNIGNPITGGPSMFTEYKGFAMKIEDANRLGLYSSAVAQSIAPSAETIAEEKKRGAAARKYLKEEAEKERWRAEVGLLNDLSEGAGAVAAGIVNVLGRVIGKTAAGFIGSLGPYGVLAVTIAAGAATAYYVVPLVKAAKRGK